MLERMVDFFESRLSGYDEHMLKNIEGAEEFYKYTAEQLPMKSDGKIFDLGCGQVHSRRSRCEHQDW